MLLILHCILIWLICFVSSRYFGVFTACLRVKGIRRYQRGRQKSLSRGQTTKDKHRTHNTTLKTKAGVTRTQQKPG